MWVARCATRSSIEGQPHPQAVVQAEQRHISDHSVQVAPAGRRAGRQAVAAALAAATGGNRALRLAPYLGTECRRQGREPLSNLPGSNVAVGALIASISCSKLRSPPSAPAPPPQFPTLQDAEGLRTLSDSSAPLEDTRRRRRRCRRRRCRWPRSAPSPPGCWWARAWRPCAPCRPAQLPPACRSGSTRSGSTPAVQGGAGKGREK